MKKINLLMAAMMLIVASFVACTDDEVDKKEPNTPNEQPTAPIDVTFAITNVKATMTDVTYTVVPSNDDAEYLVFVKDAKSVNECPEDSDIVDMLYAEVEEFATNSNTTFQAYLEANIKKGTIENGKIANLAYGTQYYLLVFAVDVEDNYAAITDVYTKSFKTEAPEASACTFDVKATVNMNTVALKVTPSVSTQLWHLINLPISEYQSYTQGDTKWTQQQLFQNYLNSEVETLQAKGLTQEEIDIKLFHQGMRTLNDSGLEPSTKYVVLVGSVDNVEGNMVLTSTTLKEIRYTTGSAAQSDLTFDIDVFNIDHYSAEIKITPSNPDAEYYYYIGYIDTPKRGATPAQIAEAAISNHVYYFNENNQYVLREPSKGVVDFTGENKYELNIAETEYFILAFSFEPNPSYGTIIDEESGTYDTNQGAITSAPVYVSFKTPEHGDATKAEFEFIATDIGPYDFYLEVNTNDPTIYYMPGVEKAEGFDGQSMINEYSGFLAQQIQMCMEGQSACLSYQEALEMKCSNFFRNGNGRYYIANLETETEYVCYLLAIDIKTATFVKCYTSEFTTTTTAAGSVNPTIEVLGVFDGSEENGSIFGDAAATNNRPIIAVKYDNIEGASALYTYHTTEGYEVENIEDTEAKSHQNIIASFRGKWSLVEPLTVPSYQFIFGTWDIAQAVVAYAQDGNGAEGEVARKEFTPKEAENIEKLREIYAEYQGGIATPAPAKSMVVATDNTPLVECIWSEEVGAPRGAEVTYRKVELNSVASDLVHVKVIKSFHI